MRAISLDEQRFARTRGMVDDRIAELWEEHCEWCEREGREPGSFLWRTFLNRVIERENAEASEAKALDAKARQAEVRRAEEQAREKAETAAYKKASVPFGVPIEGQGTPYIASLLMKPNAAMTDAERLLLFTGSLREGESFWAFMDRAFSKDNRAEYARFAAEEGHDPIGPVKRFQRCPCGAPVKSWKAEGRMYFGARCGACMERDRAQARRTG